MRISTRSPPAGRDGRGRGFRGESGAPRTVRIGERGADRNARPGGRARSYGWGGGYPDGWGAVARPWCLEAVARLRIFVTDATMKKYPSSAGDKNDGR